MSTQSTAQRIHTENLQEIDRLTSNLQFSIIKNTKKVLVGDDINFTGGLSKSVQPDVDTTKDQKIVKVDSPYGVPVEFGMPSGIHVNFDELKKWVEGKLGVSPDESVKVTSKIWHKILNVGINPTRFFKKGIKMTIADHGILNLRTTKPKLSKLYKMIKKATKSMKKMKRNLNKAQHLRKKMVKSNK